MNGHVRIRRREEMGEKAKKTGKKTTEHAATTTDQRTGEWERDGQMSHITSLERLLPSVPVLLVRVTVKRTENIHQCRPS